MLYTEITDREIWEPKFTFAVYEMREQNLHIVSCSF